MDKNLKGLGIKAFMYLEVTSFTDKVCSDRLTEEYAQLARDAASALCRKRPSPVRNGQPEGWACGIVYALGYVNSLFDKNDEPYIGAADLCAAFGVSEGTEAARSKAVRDVLKMRRMDAKWSLPSKMT